VNSPRGQEGGATKTTFLIHIYSSVNFQFFHQNLSCCWPPQHRKMKIQTCTVFWGSSFHTFSRE